MDGINTSTMGERGNMSLHHGKKSINLSGGGDVHLDSGYASSASISYNQSNTTVHSPYISTSIVQSSKRSIELEPIAEHYDSPTNVETPTTHSIRKLSEFHIQTPNNSKRLLETTPKKSIYRYNDIRACRSSTPKKNRCQYSPYKLNKSGLKPTDKMKRGNSRLTFDKSDFMDTENIENTFEMNVADQSLGLSPITTTITSHGGLKRTTLQRHPSGIESSTPVSRPFKRSNTQSLIKSNFTEAPQAGPLSATKRQMRKAQSFSPSKYGKTILKEISTNFQELENHNEEEFFNENEFDKLPVDVDEPNPAKRILTFSVNQFNNVLNVNAKNLTGNTQITHTFIPSRETTEAKLKPKLVKQTKIDETVDQSPSIQSENVEQKPESESPICNEEIKHSLTMEQSIKPRKVKKSIELTVPNSLSRRTRKRSASTDLSGISKTKRKLLYVERDGLEKVDFLERLRENNVTEAIEMILSKLSNEDLKSASKVSNGWKNIIDGINAASVRLINFQRRTNEAKENCEIGPRTSATVRPPQQREIFKKINTNYMLRSNSMRSPPVSPSKVRFHENQKVISLKYQQKDRQTKFSLNFFFRL